MARTVTFEVPTDTSQFTPLQLHPRAACALAMTGWARWLREYWYPFPRLIQDHNLGVVILGLDVGYERSFGFFDTDTLVATTGLMVRSGGKLLIQDTRIAPPEGPDVAHVRGVLRPVRIAEGVVLAATPTNLDGDEIARFGDDEIVSNVPGQRLQDVVSALETDGPPLAVATRTFTLHRHLCETADQWSGIALPDVATEVREDMVTASAAEVPALCAALTQPMRRITMEFRRPAFFLDEFTVGCAAYTAGDEVAFVHRFSSVPDEEVLATFVEWFPRSEDSGPGKGERR